MTLTEIATVVGGAVHGPDRVVRGPAYLDSRRPVADGLFVAVAGERVDGHRYAAHAHAVLGSRPTAAPTVVVRDPLVALGRLARHTTRTVAPFVHAVTGSHGKTSTKDLLAAVVGGVATAGNLNNELGVPLTCLRLEPADRTLVLEMGARGIGHLAYLCDLAPPSVAAVLSVGTAHVGEFGSQDLIAHAKGELVEALPARGTAVLNADDPRVAAMATRTAARVLTFGRAPAADVTWRGLSLDDRGRPSFELAYYGSRAPVRLRSAGAHQAANAAAAAAMALAHGLPLPEIAARLSAAEPASRWRMEVAERADGLLVVNDAYNASPASVRAGVEALVELGRHRSGRTIAVLGEMRELGPASVAAHQEVGRAARAAGVDLLLAVGPAAAPYGGVRVPDRDAALAWLTASVRPDDVVLVKASRGAGLERVAEGLLAAGRGAGHDLADSAAAGVG